LTSIVALPVTRAAAVGGGAKAVLRWLSAAEGSRPAKPFDHSNLA